MNSTVQTPSEIILPVPPQHFSLTRAPEDILSDATRAAKALDGIIRQNRARLVQKIGEGEHIRVEGWQVLGHFFGVTARVEWVRPLYDGEGRVTGFEARAVALRNGEIVSAGEARCNSEDEANWRNKPLFQLEGMVQTRAVSRVLRHVLSWVVVLAGYQAAPAEEAEKTRRAAAPRTEEESPAPDASTIQQQRSIHSISAARHKLSDEETHRWLKFTYGVESTKQLTKQQASEAIGILQKTDTEQIAIQAGRQPA